MSLDVRAAIPHGAEKRFGTVIFLDVLGTKAILEQDRIENFIRIFENFIDYVEATNTAVNTRMRLVSRITRREELPKWQMRAFSDTIILTCSVDASLKEQVLEMDLIKRAGFNLPYFIAKGLEWEIPLRGSFSFGEFYQSERIMVGAPVYEAAECHELPEWIGVSAAPAGQALLTKIEKEHGNTLDDYFVKWNLPTKEGFQDGVWCLTWPRRKLFESRYSASVNQYAKYIFPKIRDMMMKQFCDDRVDIAIKWQNTLEFFDSFY